MKRLRRLCEAARSMSAAVQITLHGVPDHEDAWVVRVTVGTIILVETGAGALDTVLMEATKKLASMSQRVMAAVTNPETEEDPESGTPTA
jgi:hypothetical protein